MLKINNQAGELTKTRNGLITELSEVLNQMQKGDIEIVADEKDPLSLKIVLGESENSLKFATGKYNLSPKDAAFLNKIMPKIIATLYDEKYRNSIDAIKIEGYTDDDKYSGSNNYGNVELSQARALEVLNHTRKNCLTNQNQREFFVDKASINGKGDIQNYWIKNADGTCNKTKSRRVEIKIKIKSKDEEKLNKSLNNKQISTQKVK
jgi:flagellar motor protein MotB